MRVLRAASANMIRALLGPRQFRRKKQTAPFATRHGASQQILFEIKTDCWSIDIGTNRPSEIQNTASGFADVLSEKVLGALDVPRGQSTANLDVLRLENMPLIGNFA